MSPKVSDSVGYRTARQTATAMTQFFLHTLVSLSFCDKAVFLPTWCNLDYQIITKSGGTVVLRRAFDVKYDERRLLIKDLRGGVTLNKPATHQTILPLLTAWHIKQYTSDIHLGWDDLASPLVRSSQAVRRPVRAHLRSSRYAIC